MFLPFQYLAAFLLWLSAWLGAADIISRARHKEPAATTHPCRGGRPAESPPRRHVARSNEASSYPWRRSVGELHVQEDGVHVGEHRAGNEPALGRDRGVRGLVVELKRLGHGERELAMVVEHVLGVQREAQVLIVLIGYPHDEALEVEWILIHMDVGLPPVEHPEYRHRRSRDVI